MNGGSPVRNTGNWFVVTNYLQNVSDICKSLINLMWYHCLAIHLMWYHCLAHSSYNNQRTG